MYLYFSLTLSLKKYRMSTTDQINKEENSPLDQQEQVRVVLYFQWTNQYTN